uniref:Uncharacterized protein n=1 Tax=Plectus sambesii TaxID=2011161 RepID=A0A914VN75_9BILA
PFQRGSKNQRSFLVLWAYSKERNICRPIVIKAACEEAISKLSVSECGDFTAIGTMSGSVGVFDTHEMKRLLYAEGTHGIFVTGLEFVPTTSIDVAAAPNEK